MESDAAKYVGARVFIVTGGLMVSIGGKVHEGIGVTFPLETPYE